MRHSDSRAILKERIESELREQRLTIAQLAGRAKISEGTVRGAVSGAGNPTLENLEKIANVLGLSVADLLQDPTEASFNVFSGLMRSTRDMLKHEARVLGWEREGKVRHMILPFFSAKLQTLEVYLYIRTRGCYNYPPLEESEMSSIEQLTQTIEERRQLFRLAGYISREIASKDEICKFARGEGEFSELAPEQRLGQFDSILKILETKSIPGMEIRVLEHPLYIMLGLYGENHVTMRGRGIYLEVTDKTVANQFYQNFRELWNQARRDDDLIDFLRKLRDEIS